MNRVIVKFNSGRGAVLCSHCRVIIRAGSTMTDDDWKAARGEIEMEEQFCAAHQIRYYYDCFRHLVCVPYSVENLHKMAQDLGIHKCWFENKQGKAQAHYDIPKRFLPNVISKATRVSSKDILNIIQYGHLRNTAG